MTHTRLAVETAAKKQSWKVDARKSTLSFQDTAWC